MPRIDHIIHAMGVASATFMLHHPRLHADERLENIACRSVHLAYKAPAGDLFYNEIEIEESAPGTYFCVCGFRRGYYGVQELADGRRLLIFSVWDPGDQNNPDAVEQDQRVQTVYHDEDVRIGRFGNEGTGGQSFYDYDWEVNERLRLMVKAELNGERTVYEAWFFHPAQMRWMRLAAFSTLADGKLLGGYYSFVEDFRRNRESTRHARRARFGNGWIRQIDGGTWMELNEAKFTADRNPVMNIDAGVAEGRFFLATGGDARNVGTPLWETVVRPPAAERPKIEGAASIRDND